MNHKPTDRSTRTWWLAPLVVALVTFVVFLPALRNGFVTWDDDRNFLMNERYRGLGPAELRWMWSTFHMGHYVPLSWMTLGFDYVLWGMNPAGYHLTNLMLHTANTVLLYGIARRLLSLVRGESSDDRTLDLAAAFAALAFGIHPLRVESVVWITERRDVLSGLFYFLCVLFFLKSRRDGRRWYWLAVLVFPLALLSKATAVTIPAVLLILDVYPLRRVGGDAGWWSASARRAYAELIPFASLAAATSVLSLVALRPPSQLNAAGKIAVSAWSLCFYLWKTIVPTDLAPLYEMRHDIPALGWPFLASYAAVIGISVAAWAVRRRWTGVSIAWLAFVIIIFPLLGVVQNGPQIAADRYTYQAAPVLAILAGAAIARLQWPLPTGILALAAAFLLTFSVLTWNQARVWFNSETLWTRVLEHDAESSIAHTSMASVLFAKGEFDDAIAHYERSLALDPAYADGHNNLGVALASKGRLDEAIAHYRRALGLRPAYADAHSNWGAVVARQGDLPRAIEHYREALVIDSTAADAHVNWGNALVRMGKNDEAIVHYRDALAVRHDDADAHLNWGVALAQQGKLEEAIRHFELALAINPSHADARDFLAKATEMLRGSPAR
ncbi:MAG: tetratricopeptide repeat protein [bacterium]